MTHKERVAAALNRKIPDHVPTFELEFQLAEEMFGKPLFPDKLKPGEIEKLSAAEKDKALHEMAEYAVYVYQQLDYSIYPLNNLMVGNFQNVYGDTDGALPPEFVTLARYMREACNDKAYLAFHGDGTFSVPDGNEMYEFAYRTADDPEGLMEEAERKAQRAIRQNKQLMDAGVEVLLLCCDYCYNNGPFLSPQMFRQFIQPYLYKIVQSAKADGHLVIKHTDGNIMPILDQMVECEPHALHSIDPMAGVDIREVKRLVGDKVALCGNVNCALMQTGTDQEVIDSMDYCLNYAKPGGGYIFCTSNVAFKGMPPERYQMMLDYWKLHRDY